MDLLLPRPFAPGSESSRCELSLPGTFVLNNEYSKEQKFQQMRRCTVATSTLDLCYASSEEIPELQHPRRATGNRRNLQCEDDSVLRANVTQDIRTSGRLSWVWWGPRSGGSALLVVGSSVLVSILLCSLSMSGAALSTRLMGALRFRGSCS